MACILKMDDQQPGTLLKPEKYRIPAGQTARVFLTSTRGRGGDATVREQSILTLRRLPYPTSMGTTDDKWPYALFARRMGTATIFVPDPGFNQTITVEVTAGTAWAPNVEQLKFYPGQRLPGTSMCGALYVLGSDDVRVPATCSPHQGLGTTSRIAQPPQPGSYVLSAANSGSWNLRRDGRPTPHYIHVLPNDPLSRDAKTRELLDNTDGNIFVSHYVRQRLVAGRLLRSGTPFEVMKLGEFGPSFNY